jgi:hypothetical protein
MLNKEKSMLQAVLSATYLFGELLGFLSDRLWSFL